MATSKFYDVNFKRLALLLLPTFRRRPLLAAVAYASVSPLQWLHTRFMLWRRDTDYRLLHNGQVCRLRGLLNDLFDPIERRITVTEEAPNVGNILFYKREMQRAVRLPVRGSGRTVVLNRRGYGGVSGYDFWVNIPVALLGETDTDRLRAVVDAYKLASKRYQINFV